MAALARSAQSSPARNPQEPATYTEVEIELTRQAAEGFTQIIEAAVENVGGWTPKQRADFGVAFRTELAKAVADAPGSSDLYGHASAAPTRGPSRP